MAREIETRWKISGTLKAKTPIHVGGVGGDADTDLALAVNGRGNYYLPGTSLAGAFRGWMESLLGEENKDQLKDIWGDHESDKYGASFLILNDAEIQGKQKIEIREGVAIDRHTGAAGAAAEGFKYSRAILPKGAEFPLNITFDSQNGDPPAELWHLLQALEKGDIRIGAAKTRGLGRVQLHHLKIEKQLLNNAKGLFDALINGGETQDWTAIKGNYPYKAPDNLNVDIAWIPRDPVMVKAEGDGIAVDMLPLVSQVDSGVRFVIPGSSIKGVLRAHAERIVRTVRQIDISDLKFDKQLQISPIDVVSPVEVLFGSAEKNSGKSKNGKAKSNGQIGTISIDDCYATIPMSATDWAKVENATSMEKDLKPHLKAALGGKGNPYEKLQPAMHVAVDRWTGGAADGMLYSVLEPIGLEWEAIGLQVDLARLKKYHEALVQPAIALLLLVLRDFANRKIPIGYGTNRGMGTVAVTNMKLNTSGTLDDLPGLEGEISMMSESSKFDLFQLDDELLLELTIAWQEWVEQN